MFRVEAPRQLGNIREAIARHDHAAVVLAAHQLKGSIANFRFPSALDAAERLEATARRAEAGDVGVASDTLDQAFGRLTAEILNLIEEQTPVR